MNTSKQSGLETLQLSRLIPAEPDRVFRAWTDPKEIRKWWGPTGVKCLSAELDLRIGGQFRIANGLPDGSIVWISGSFEQIERPHLLIYSWILENENPTTERVEVRFDRNGPGTNVTITHERIATQALSEQHRQGWIGCMDGLVEYLGT